MAESEEKLKSLLKEQSEKADLKLNIKKTKIMHPVPSLHGKQKGKMWKRWWFLSSWAPKPLQTITAVIHEKVLAPCKESNDKPRQHIKKQRHHFADRGLYRQSYGFSCGGGGNLVAKSCLTLENPWTVACQAPLSVGFSRQEYWRGLPFTSPGIFLTEESNLGLLHCTQIISVDGEKHHLWNKKPNSANK